jgi:deazaflavin-dependent oxidoreductase (nitroreductase family)
MSDKKWYNPIVTWLLRSPLHWAMSGSTALITVSGRRSGQPYTLPISYHRAGDNLTLITRRDKTWWRNLRGGAPVRVVIRGQERPGFAEIVPLTRAGLVAAIEQVWPRLPPKRAEALAANSILVRIALAPEAVAPPEASPHA